MKTLTVKHYEGTYEIKCSDYEFLGKFSDDYKTTEIYRVKQLDKEYLLECQKYNSGQCSTWIFERSFTLECELYYNEKERK